MPRDDTAWDLTEDAGSDLKMKSISGNRFDSVTYIFKSRKSFSGEGFKCTASVSGKERKPSAVSHAMEENIKSRTDSGEAAKMS